MPLKEYQRKRDFRRTPEPRGVVRRHTRRLAFVVQKHAATRLHYDFRLEHAGVLLSWAVPKGPSFDPADKRLAVHVEDHPLDYGGFEGVIPKGEYGAGPVLLWDRGTWTPKGDVDEGLRAGRLEFQLAAEKLSGGWILVRMQGRDARNGRGDRNWLLIKARDAAARGSGDEAVTELRPESVLSGRTIEEIAAGAPPRTARRRRTRPSPSRAPVGPIRCARRAALPETIEPQLATLVDSAPTDERWVHEIKFDGYRTLARLEKGRVRWRTRTGLDWTARFKSLSPAIEGLPAQRALLDGEIVVLRPDGTSSFADLQQALSKGTGSLVYYAFDLLHLDGQDLRECPLLERKRVLRELFAGLDPEGPVRFSDHVEGGGTGFHREACRLGLEGVVSKLADRPYRSGRGRDWVKVKCQLAQEFVVAGYTRAGGSRIGLGALVLGVREKGRFRYAGRVGTGFDRETLLRLRRMLDPLRVPSPPFEEPLPSGAARGVTWVRASVVVAVRFTGWTSDGLLRHPSFEGVREDKPASEVVREVPRASAASSARVAKRSKPSERAADGAIVAGVAITHPDRVLYEEPRVTKLDLARFYERIAPRVLPHVEGRPLAVLRCPRGAGDECFFQKHGGGTFPDAVGAVEIQEKSGPARYFTVDSTAGLVSLVQMGILELHPWGSRNDRPDQPDRMIFDVDPAPEVPWERVADAARLVRDVLSDLGLRSFLKTTGGKGLHVVVPLARKLGWDDVKAFSRAVAMQIAKSDPRRYLATASKALRRGRIYVDYLRNARGATAVAAFSTRARPGAPVSTPIAWEELDRGVRADSFGVGNLEERLRRQRKDPWADFAASRQSIPASARRALGL